ASYRDFYEFADATDDGLVKLDVSYCPIVGGHGDCTPTCCDPDADGVCASADNCPDDANPDQADTDADGVGDVCDNCTKLANPKVAAGFLDSNPWATLTGDQRDDDHDGYGNKCDAKFPGVGGLLVGAGDLTQFRVSNGKIRTSDTCGTTRILPCAVFD